jgi:hypothetical protein
VHFLIDPILPFEFNVIELASAALVLAGLANLARLWRWKRRDVALAFLLWTPLLLLTVTETTQFMTMDEWSFSLTLLGSLDGLVAQLLLGAFHTGAPFLFTLAKLLGRWGVEPDVIRMLLKAGWWLLGTSLLFAIAINVLCLAGLSVRRAAIPLTAIFSSLVLLPTSQLAVKTLNYDLISMTCGVLAILLALRAFRETREGLLVASLVVASFGAQEKLIVGPVVVILVVLWALWRAIAVPAAGRRMLAAMGWAVVGLLIPFSIAFSSLAAFAGIALTEIPPGFFATSLDLLSSWAWVPLGLVWPINVILAHRVVVALMVGFGIVLFTGVVAALAPSLLGWVHARELEDRVASPLLSAGILLGVFSVGAVTAVTLVPYWAPFHPSSLPDPSIGQSLNGVRLHVGMTSVAAHYFGLAAYAVAVVMVALPTSLWLVGGLFIGRTLRPAMARSDRCDAASIYRDALMLSVIGIAIPVAVALVGIPFAHRYFNLPICALACAIILLGLQSYPRNESKIWSTSAVAGLVGLMIVEAYPFRPLFAAFRPFWLSYADSERAELGRLNPSWMEWGEEIMRLGKQVDQACRAGDPRFGSVPCNEVTLHLTSSGRWLPGPTSIRLEASGEPRLDEKTFVAMNRLYLIQAKYNIPAIEPDFVASYRGFALGWVFRGDRLAAAGYRLN